MRTPPATTRSPSASTASSTASPPWTPTALGGEEADAEGEYAGGERNRAGPQDHDRAVGRGDALPGRRREEPAGHEDGGDRDTQPRNPVDRAGQCGGIGQDLADQPEAHEYA